MNVALRAVRKNPDNPPPVTINMVVRDLRVSFELGAPMTLYALGIVGSCYVVL
jgi:hypothetical protein